MRNQPLYDLGFKTLGTKYGVHVNLKIKIPCNYGETSTSSPRKRKRYITSLPQLRDLCVIYRQKIIK